jgi:hypothetical protein
MVQVQTIPRKNVTIAQASYQKLYRMYPVIYIYQSESRKESNQSLVKHKQPLQTSRIGIEERRGKSSRTSAGPLLVEDAVAALPALDNISRLQRVLSSTI